jgi:hypothetical protein
MNLLRVQAVMEQRDSQTVMPWLRHNGRPIVAPG